LKNEIRCEHCGRLLAKYDDETVEIRTSRKEKILILRGLIHFVCPWSVFTDKGRIKCGKTTKFESSGAFMGSM
jgi:hypothetical protein